MIRERTDDDLVACAAALRSVHETDRYPHSWPRDPIDWLRPPRQERAWVAAARCLCDTTVAGHVAVNDAEGDPALQVSTRGAGLPATRLIVVSRLFVVSAFRLQGIARALLDHAVAHAHSSMRRPVLDVLEADAGAVAFYDRIGWERIGNIVFRSRQGEPLPALVYAGPEPPETPAL
jgi:GNAT superfamily N-acetyltransferase